MTLDLVLAIAHHMAVFTLVGLLAAEIAVVREGIDGPAIKRLAALDGAYGGVAGLVLLVGFLRVFFGAGSSEVYFANPVFWAKIGAFLAVGLLSIAPTLAFARWHKAVSDDPDFVPPAGAVARARKFFLAQVVVLAFIPVFAAAMARGYGL